MARDVFKYLKASRELLEAKAVDDNAKAREEAERLGGTLVPGTFGNYEKNGQYIGKIENGKFVPKKEDLATRMANSPAGRAETEAEKKSLGQFEKEADKRKPETKLSALPQIPDGVSDAEYTDRLAKEFSGGREVSKDREEFNRKAAKTKLAQMRQASDASVPEEEPETPEEEPKVTEEPPEKKPEDFPTLDDKIEEINIEEGKNFDGSLRQGDVDIATEESIAKVEEIASTDVEDPRFDGGRESKKEFLDYYSKDSENRAGLNTLNSVTKSRDKVDQMMKAVNNGDYLEEIEITKGNKKTVSELLLDVGIDVNDQAQMDCFKNAHKEINNFVDDRGKFKTSESSELTGSNLGHYEARHIEKRTDLSTMDVGGVQTKGFNLRNDAGSNMQCVTPTITDAVYNLLPTEARGELAKSGSPPAGKYYDPKGKNRQGNANRIRGSAALHMWIMQDGKDAYATAGRRRSPGEFQVEHITPLKSGGKDEIENFSMLLRRVNEPRADQSFEKFLAQVKTKASDLKADLSNPKTREKFEKKYRSSRYNDNFAPTVGGTVSSLTSDDVMSSVNKSLQDNLSEKAASNLKVKSEDFKNYQQEVQGFLDKNGLDGDAEVKNMTSDQMNGVFDIMVKNLGVDKTKLVEYMGRNVLNNYDVGARTVINKEGELERGRSGTQSSSGNLTNMQNSVLTDDSFEPEEKKKIQQKINENHQQFKKVRNNYIDNPNDPQAFEDYLDSMSNNFGYLTGDGDSPLSPDRKYDTRLTPSEKNTLDDDVLKGIIGMLTVDKGSLEKDKDVFSPGRQKEITPKAKEHIKALRKKMVDAASRSTGLTPKQIEDPDSLKASDRKKITTLTNALENIDRGLEQ